MDDYDIVFNKAQLEFLQKYHETIEVGVIVANFLGSWVIINKLMETTEYQELFSDFSWDSVYDYYEDTPTYDKSLYEKLYRQLKSISNWLD